MLTPCPSTQHIGVCTNAKDSTVGQRSGAQGEKMDVDAPGSAPAAPPPGAEGGTSYAIGTNSLCYRRDDMEVDHPMEDGIVKKWDLMEKV